MKDNQRIYLDKVIEFLVRDTKIDYDEDRISYPYGGLSTTIKGFSIDPFFMSQYCKNVYGLTGEEIDYVWNEYKRIILDKITNK